MEIPDDILKILQNSSIRANCIDVPSEPARTIILIGRTRTGKSTIAAVLKNSIYAPHQLSIYCGTEEPFVEKVGGLTIIDMPGFFNQNHIGSRVNLDNEVINQMLSKKIRTVNESQTLYAFVFNVANGINTEDISTMLLVKRKYPHISKRLMLVLTHCEEINAHERTQLIDNFFNEESVKRNRLRELFEYGVLYMGCIRPESIEQHNVSAILREYANVVNMRKEFIQRIYSVTNHAASVENSGCCRSLFISRCVCVGLIFLLCQKIITYRKQT